MNEIDITFFEAYKRLDKLCMDLLSSNTGVSEYISQMEASTSGQRYVPSWNNDYQMLKHLRWVRNQIAHDITGGTISDEADLTMVRDFYERIFSGEDPFTQLRKAQDREQELLHAGKRQARKTRNTITDDTSCSASPQDEKRESRIVFVALTAVIALIIVVYSILKVAIQ